MEDSEEVEIEKIRLVEARAYIAGQANGFDTTDTKTGAALGFAFIAIFQILAGALRASPAIFHRNCALSCLQWIAFGLLVTAFLTALVASVISRWPRPFENHAEIGNQATQLAALTMAVSELERVGHVNDDTLEKKRHWAQVTYFAVTIAILSSLLLSSALYIATAAFPAP
jgi:hypothetical protein